ncbi:MAG: hypothetical protein IMZ52_01590 [Actinobacteria bacterium]|nr:hypothetical protein [Actinomycetota bacterium]MBE3114825.1 hypothetical protein [Actinomycetota bacterium]
MKEFKVGECILIDNFWRGSGLGIDKKSILRIDKIDGDMIWFTRLSDDAENWHKHDWFHKHCNPILFSVHHRVPSENDAWLLMI